MGHVPIKYTHQLNNFLEPNMIPMMILHLSNGTQYICSQVEANRWMDNKWLARTIVRSEYL